MQVTQERLLKRLATIIAKILYIGDLDPATLSDLAEMLRLIVRVKRRYPPISKAGYYGKGPMG
jgi:hypothetical protein